MGAGQPTPALLARCALEAPLKRPFKRLLSAILSRQSCRASQESPCPNPCSGSLLQALPAQRGTPGPPSATPTATEQQEEEQEEEEEEEEGMEVELQQEEQEQQRGEGERGGEGRAGRREVKSSGAVLERLPAELFLEAAAGLEQGLDPAPGPGQQAQQVQQGAPRVARRASLRQRQRSVQRVGSGAEEEGEGAGAGAGPAGQLLPEVAPPPGASLHALYETNLLSNPYLAAAAEVRAVQSCLGVGVWGRAHRALPGWLSHSR